MYPLDIPGISGEERLAKEGSRLRGTSYEFVFNKDANEKTVMQLVSEIPSDMAFMFYDEEYPSPSDPGAFVIIQKELDRYKMERTNHGWSKKGSSISFDKLVGYLSGCIKYNTGPDSMHMMRLYPAASLPPKKWWQFWR